MKSKVANAKKSVKKAKRSPKLKVVAGKKKTKRQQEKISALILDHRENGRKLARSILRRWRVRMSAEEVDSIVDLTLCEAAERFREDKGASFMTFLYYHLRGQLVRAVASATQASNLFIACAESAGLEVSDNPQFADVLDDQQTRIFFAEELGFSHLDEETPEVKFLKKERADICSEACDKLDALEKEIITRSFAKEESLVDIAKSLGYSRCHVSRVKKGALERLKAAIGEIAPEANVDGKLSHFASRAAKPKKLRSLNARRTRRRRIETAEIEVEAA